MLFVYTATSAAQINERKSQEVCGLCVLAFNRIQAVLQQNTTEASIKQFLDNVCRVLPDEKNSQICLNTVEKNLADIYNLIRSNLDPGIICRYLKACDDSFKRSMLTSFLNGNSSFQCDICHVAIEIVDYELKNNQTEVAITNQLKNLCSLFPTSSPIHNECLNIFTQFGPVVIEIVGNDLDPNTVCHFLEFCTDSSNSQTTSLTGQFECNLCETFAQIADTLLELNTTKGSIVNFFSIIVCSALFKSPEAKDQCNAFILEYGDAVLDLIAKELDPAKVCSVLKLCNSSKKNYLPVSLINTKELIEILAHPRNNLLNTLECQICTYLANIADKFLQSNKTEQEIFDELSKVCNIFSSDVKPQCSAFVNEYGPYVIYLLVNEITPDATCKAIGFCSTSKKFLLN